MPSDNPFAEPHDSDKTVFIPTPGGRRAAPPPDASRAPPPQPMAAAPVVPQGPTQISTGSNPLLAAASALLALLGRLRNTANAPDSGDLRDRAVAELRRFEATARDGGVPIDQLRPAHYALCAALDDVVLATPWGAQGSWGTRSLVSTFHQQVRSGEGFFAVLKQVTQAPAANLPVLELMYFCLSLGFQGQYRLSPRGPAELEGVRENLYALIVRQRGAMEAALSPHWRGVDAPYRPRRAELPVWVAATLGLAIVAGLFVWAMLSLGSTSDAVYESLSTAPPAVMPQISRSTPVQLPPPPVEPGALDRITTFLAPEIAKGLVSVIGTEAVPIVRINNNGLFASGSANVEPSVDALLGRIGQALKTEPGPVTVAGYTDNQPIHTVQFPSNFELSSARAKAAMAIIQAAEGEPSRFTAEGLGDADPIATNDTAAGREQNRRIEVILHRQE